MPHLDDGLIHELLDGEIPSAELPPITAHLAACPACRARLEAAQAMMAEADGLIETLDLPPSAPTRAPAPAPAPVRPPMRWVRPLAWAASLVIAAAGGYAARDSVQLLPAPSPMTNSAPVPVTDKVAAAPPATVATQSPLPPPPRMHSSEPAAKANSPMTSGGRQAIAEQAQPTEVSKARAEPPAPTPVAPTLGAGVGALRDAMSGNAVRRADENRGLVPREQVTSKQLVDGVPARRDTIGLPDAMRLLGGRIRLIDGLVPLRLEAQGTEVRVIYPLAEGDLLLIQRLVNGRIIWDLRAPADFSVDSLQKLHTRVRE